ncbi:MAG: aminoacetone oxidase family FAD-binding enzyme, partial [Ruminococcus sp.]|nr:aminoacetone oxidase family FAD-binding enzyme [Ruminococcus sp.]
MNKIIIIGGGASGLMAAGFASMYGADVTVFEKMPRIGRKIMITGKGRCNLANACDVQTFMQNVPVNNKFLYSSLNNFPPFDIIEFFEEQGLKTKIERGNRVFPESDKAIDVVDTMRSFAERNGAKIINETAEDVISENGVIKAVKAGGKIYNCKSVIIATGGASYPRTGTTGDGYKFAKKLGHTIIEPKPSLIPLECSDSDCKSLQGLSLKNVSLKIKDKNGKLVYDDFGEMLFTHFGISGPMVLSASCNMRDYSL